jgi:hypothetical protein
MPLMGVMKLGKRALKRKKKWHVNRQHQLHELCGGAKELV